MLILAEEFLGVFNEADDDNDGRASHADEEHDLKDVHCEDAESHSKIVCRNGGDLQRFWVGWVDRSAEAQDSVWAGRRAGQ